MLLSLYPLASAQIDPCAAWYQRHSAETRLECTPPCRENVFSLHYLPARGVYTCGLHLRAVLGTASVDITGHIVCVYDCGRGGRFRELLL